MKIRIGNNLFGILLKPLPYENSDGYNPSKNDDDDGRENFFQTRSLLGTNSLDKV